MILWLFACNCEKCNYESNQFLHDRKYRICLFKTNWFNLRRLFRRLYIKISIIKCFYTKIFIHKIIEIVALRVSRRFQEFNESAFFFSWKWNRRTHETFENKKNGIVKNYHGQEKLCNRFENSADSCSKKILFKRHGTICSLSLSFLKRTLLRPFFFWIGKVR